MSVQSRGVRPRRGLVGAALAALVATVVSQPSGAGADEPQSSDPAELESGSSEVSAQPGGKGRSLLPEVQKNPPAPDPEPIEVGRLPLPPTAPTDADGSVIDGGCTNPTGCMSPAVDGIHEGPSYMWDNEHVLLTVDLVGAPEGSIYSGTQVLAIKTTDGATFSNGDAWKCLTCGVPAENQEGRNQPLDHPQALHDGQRLLVGTNILDCSPHVVTDDECTPDQVRIHPIRWNVTADGSGPGGSMRELRLNADDVTLGWSSFTFTPTGAVTQFSYAGRLTFNPEPTTGEPMVARYDLENVHGLFTDDPDHQVFRPDPKNPGEVLRGLPPSLGDGMRPGTGELRGFTSDGKEVIGIGYPQWSNRVDLFATDLKTGKVRPVTRTEYIDPIKMSPDDKWSIGMDVHVSGRSKFLGAMEGLPPINDMITIGTVSQVRNNQGRRFFQPMLVDRYGQRGDYQGQQINACDDPADEEVAGSICDPNWNGRADPAWSPDGTKVVYWQSLVTARQCGGDNPLPCPDSTEPGGRRTRLMIADLTSRNPLPVKGPVPVRDVGDWADPFVPGEPAPVRPVFDEGTYTLRGRVSGTATFEITHDVTGTEVDAVSVIYDDYADDGCRTFNGHERVEVLEVVGFNPILNWDSDITLTGCQTGTKITRGPDGEQGPMTMSAIGTRFEATGTLTTTIDGVTYTQPQNGT